MSLGWFRSWQNLTICVGILSIFGCVDKNFIDPNQINLCIIHPTALKDPILKEFYPELIYSDPQGIHVIRPHLLSEISAFLKTYSESRPDSLLQILDRPDQPFPMFQSYAARPPEVGVAKTPDQYVLRPLRLNDPLSRVLGYIPCLQIDDPELFPEWSGSYFTLQYQTHGGILIPEKPYLELHLPNSEAEALFKLTKQQVGMYLGVEIRQHIYTIHPIERGIWGGVVELTGNFNLNSIDAFRDLLEAPSS